MIKATFLALIVTVFTACGTETIKNGDILANTIDNNASVNNTSFKKCAEELAPIISIFNGLFGSQRPNSPFLVNHITGNIDENFASHIKELTFTKEDPCKQLQVAFSGNFANNIALKLKISKEEANRSLAKFKKFKVDDFFPSYLAITNEVTPDNMNRLPDHYFEVTVSCPDGMNLFCSPEQEKCDTTRPLKAEFPKQACSIKANDQVFALYPDGQVIVNFEGIISKARITENDIDEIEILFTNIEWK